MAKQNKKKQERKLAAREKHKNNSKYQENDSTDDPDLEKQLDRINLKLSYGFYELSNDFYRTYHWKTHPKQIICRKMIFRKFRGVKQTVLLDNPSKLAWMRFPVIRPGS